MSEEKPCTFVSEDGVPASSAAEAAIASGVKKDGEGGHSHEHGGHSHEHGNGGHGHTVSWGCVGAASLVIGADG